MQGLEEAIRKAVSFSGSRPPNGAEHIGTVLRETGEYIYYRDEEGNYYYNTAAGLRFAKLMERKK